MLLLLEFQDDTIFEMTDIDAGSVLLPVSEEPSPLCESLTDTAQQKPEPRRVDSVVVDTTDGRQRELPHREDQTGTSVRSAYLDEVKEELRQIRERDTQKTRQS